MTAEPIELIVSDVDGTIVRPDKSVAPATVQAVRRAQAAGIRVTLVSSRPVRGMFYPVETLGIAEPFCAFNGGTMVGPDRQVMSARHVDAAAARWALDFFDRHGGVDVWVFADDQWLLRSTTGEYVPRERRTVQFEPTVVADFEPVAGRIDKIVAASSDHALLSRLEAEAAAALAGQANARRSQLYYLDVTAIGADKGQAVTDLAARFGIPLARVAVIGDAANDIPMFEKAGLSVAMGQGEDAVRARANLTTGSNAEDGAAAAILQHIVPRAPRRAEVRA